MHVQILRTRGELAKLRESWNRLPRPSPMQSLAWYLAWWDAYSEPGLQLSVATVMEAGELIAAAPWYSKTSLGVQQWRFMGDGQACGDHATVLCLPGREKEVVTVLTDWMLDDPHVRWDQLALESIDDDDLVVAALVDAFTARGCPGTRRHEPGSCYVDLPDTWDEYLAGVSKNHRKRCRRWQKAFFATGRAQVEIIRHPDRCCAALETLLRLHVDRRTSLGQSGAFESTQFRVFHDKAIAALSAGNQLQLRILHVDKQPVAAEYVLDDGRALYAYQSGLSTTGTAISAGNLSVLAMVHDAIAAGYRRLDLLRGTEPYKFSWGAIHRPAQTHVIRHGTPTGHVVAWCDAAWGRARKLKRRFVDSTQ